MTGDEWRTQSWGLFRVFLSHKEAYEDLPPGAGPGFASPMSQRLSGISYLLK